MPRGEQLKVNGYPIQLWIRVSPLLRGVPEKRDVEQIRFRRVSDGCLRGRDFRWNQVRLHRVCVDTVIQLRQCAIEIPREREPAVLVCLEP